MMVYCPTCGSKIDDEMEFCPNCGEPLKNISGQQDESAARGQKIAYKAKEKKKEQGLHNISSQKNEQGYTQKNFPGKRKNKHASIKKILKGIVLLLLIGGLISSGLFFFAPSIDIDEDLSYQHTFSNEANASEISGQEFNIEVSSTNVYYQYNSSPMQSIIELNAQFDFIFQGWGVESLSDVYKITWENSQNITEFKIEWKPKFGSILKDQSRVNIILRSDVKFSFKGSSSTGKIYFESGKNTLIEQLNLKVSTGSLNINLKQGTSIKKDFSVDSSTGNVQIYGDKVSIGGDLRFDMSTGSLDIEFLNCQLNGTIEGEFSTGETSLKLVNCTYPNEETWKIDGSTGNLRLNIIQKVNQISNIQMDIELSTGNIYLNFTGEAGIGAAKFEGDVSTGDLNFHPNSGFTQTNNLMESLNFGEIPGYYGILEASTGNINVYGQMV